jgi:1-acyl-sn-glycerol-3-phosphate acyltransferase
MGRLLVGPRVLLVALGVVLPVAALGVALCRSERSSWWLAGWMMRLAGRLTGVLPHRKVRLPEGPFVAVSNHASNLDPLVLIAALDRPVVFIAKREMFGWPLVGAYTRRLGAIPVERGRPGGRARAFRAAVRAARDGRPVHVFPESTISARPGLRPFRPGAFRLAAEHRLPIVPLAIVGTRRALPPGSWLPRPARVEVRVLEAVAPPAAPGGPEALAAFREQVRRALAEAVGEPLLEPEGRAEEL